MVDNKLIVQLTICVQGGYSRPFQADGPGTGGRAHLAKCRSHYHHQSYSPYSPSADRPVSHRAEDTANRNHRSGRCRGFQVQTEIPDSARSVQVL